MDFVPLDYHSAVYGKTTWTAYEFAHPPCAHTAPPFQIFSNRPRAGRLGANGWWWWLSRVSPCVIQARALKWENA